MSASIDPPLTWAVWPLRSRPLAAVGLLLSTGALATLAGVIGGDLLWGLLAAFLVLVWLNGFLLPTRFEASSTGVSAAGPLFTRRLAWRDATRLAIQSSGGWLGRAAGPRWRRRGIDLLWSPAEDVPDRLIAVARQAGAAIDVRDLRSTSARGATGQAPTSGRRSSAPASVAEPVHEEPVR